MKKILKIFSTIVIILFILSVFGWTVNQISNKNKRFGFLTGPIKFMYTFPDLFSQSLEEVKTLPNTFILTPDSFESINHLDFDVPVLTTYSNQNDSRSIVLLNLKDDSILYKWTVKNPYQAHDRIMNPLLLPGKSIVYSFFNKSNLRRIDSLSNIIWKRNDILTHHSMNLDKKGDIWICSAERASIATGTYKLNGRSEFYIDNFITKIDAETGKILFHKSFTEILEENNMGNYILKSSKYQDPIHINDIEPALQSTKHYEQDDLFISSRNLSLVMHYRPSTNEVINILEGPFISQHDVDFREDGSLMIFNNNFYIFIPPDINPLPYDSTRLKSAGDFYSNIIHYDFEKDCYSFFGDSVFRANEIFTKTEGLMDFIDPKTYFVEEQNTGVLWIIRDNKVIYKNILKSHHEGYHHLPNWTRIIQYD